MKCGCTICKQWSVVERRAKSESAPVASALINKLIGSAFATRDAAKTLATCPSVVAAMKARDRLRFGLQQEEAR